MKYHNKHKRRLRQRLIHKYKQHLKFFLYLAALVLLIIGNNFASFRSDDQPGQGNYTGGNSSPGDNKGIGGVQGGLTSIHPNTSLSPKLGIVKQLQTESTFVYPWSNIWGSGGQWGKLYIQSAMNPQNSGSRDWEGYLLASLGPSGEHYQTGFGHHLSDDRSGSSLSLVNQDGGGANPAGPFVGSPLEYPHSSNYGRSYNEGSGGGSSALSGSGGGGGGGSILPKTVSDPQQVPEPSTFILTAIGLLFVVRRMTKNRIQGVEDSSIQVRRSDEGSE